MSTSKGASVSASSGFYSNPLKPVSLFFSSNVHTNLPVQSPRAVNIQEIHSYEHCEKLSILFIILIID